MINHFLEKLIKKTWDIVKEDRATIIWFKFSVLIWVTVNIKKIINKQLNIVIGSVFINKFLNERLSLYFSYKRCLIECKKQKYIKKDTNGLKYIKQNKSNVNSIIRFTDVFLSIKLIRKNKKIKIVK